MFELGTCIEPLQLSHFIISRSVFIQEHFYFWFDHGSVSRRVGEIFVLIESPWDTWESAMNVYVVYISKRKDRDTFMRQTVNLNLLFFSRFLWDGDRGADNKTSRVQYTKLYTPRIGISAVIKPRFSFFYCVAGRVVCVSDYVTSCTKRLFLFL